MDDMKSMLNTVYMNNKEFESKGLNEVTEAMRIVDRKFFVPLSSIEFCYADMPLEIGYGQTISQPSTVARMLLLAKLKSGLNVLEVGSGSGWSACLTSFLVYPGKTLTIERIDYLTEVAKKNFERFRNYLKKENKKELEKFQNLRIETLNALDEKSIAWQMKYDRIIITAGIPFDAEIEKTIKKMAEKLLKKLGILICPQISGPLQLYKKDNKNELILEETQEDYVFVPLLKGRE